ncbi:DMT family transporter [Lysinibacillus sp. FSL H8-0500]|uniref:Membrane protein n=1 Tax=Lysinibacillus macroides TaxID=33935 RepID=A0A0M9DP91_9BACI|nr:DMT family transporter [Lysinibacillus macroides]KOY84182.1 membrane protein [Lysinibacillus macroides]QPR66958.1 DMT family transporter [Lysinibacillus macroides]
MKTYIADGMLLITAIVWGSGFVVTAIALEYLTAYQLMAARFTLATLILILLFGKRLRKASKSVIWKGAILGAILYTAFALQTVGLEYTTPSKNAFLTAVNVIIVPLIALAVYKRRIDGYEIIGAFMAIFGIGLLSLEGSLTMNIGDLLSLACAVGFAFDIFYTNLFVKKEDPITLTIIQFMSASIIGIIIVMGQGGMPTSLEKEGMLSIVYLAIFSTVIAYLCQNIAYKYTSATKGAIILSTESFFGMVFSVIFLHEILTGRMMAGAVLILLAIIIAEVKPAYPKKQLLDRNI